jgi:hypothetical protein
VLEGLLRDRHACIVVFPPTSFFEPPPPPERRPPHRPPPWHAPPENELGAAVPIRLLLARTDELALALLDVVAYTTGFSMRLALRFQPGAEIDPRNVMMQMHGGGPEQLRFGIAFVDGRKATNLGMPRPPSDEPPEISLTRGGGGGGGGRGWEFGYWAYPLPPPGQITLVVDWPARDLPESRHELDAAPIIEAAATSEKLWDDDRPIGRGGPSSTTWGISRRPDAPPPAPGR